jgi:hypothetical protein
LPLRLLILSLIRTHALVPGRQNLLSVLPSPNFLAKKKKITIIEQVFIAVLMAVGIWRKSVVVE